MEMKVVERTEDTLRIQIDEPDDTLIYPLVHQILQDEDVADAQYSVGHPMLDKPLLVIRTKKGEPQAALKKAAEALSAEYAQAREQLKQALGR
jgi:DNA-directed RNA polymerase subunit L